MNSEEPDVNTYLTDFDTFLRTSLDIQDEPTDTTSYLESIRTDPNNKRMLVLYIRKGGVLNKITYGMPVPDEFPYPAVFPGMTKGELYPPKLPTIETVDADNSDFPLWSSEILRIRAPVTDMKKARLLAALTVYWTEMHRLIHKKLRNAGIMQPPLSRTRSFVSNAPSRVSNSGRSSNSRHRISSSPRKTRRMPARRIAKSDGALAKGKDKAKVKGKALSEDTRKIYRRASTLRSKGDPAPPPSSDPA